MRRRLPPPPKGDPDGTWIFDPINKVEVFMPFDLIHDVCKQVMDPANSMLVAQELGKIHYSQDPTYEMRRKRR